MVATVGSIAIDLAVKSAAFEAGFRKAATTVDRESARMSRSVAGAEKAIASLSSAGARLGGAFAGALAGREIVRYADAWTEAGNKIRAAGEIAGRQARGLRELNDIATETRSGLTETVGLYSKLLLATKGVAKSEQEVATATEIVNKAFKAGGAAASEQAAGILQLGQALASGVLQGDELRSLRENAPLIAQAIANEFKTTIGGLKDLGANGELTADRVFKAILNAQQSIDKAFAQTEITIAEGLTRVQNAGIELIGTLSEVTGGAGSLAGELSRFADEIEDTADRIRRFANDPSIRSFFEDLAGGSIREGSIADDIRDSFARTTEEVKADIAEVEAKLLELEGTAAAFGGNDFDLLNLERERGELASLRAELQRMEMEGHANFVALHRSAEDASMRALEAFREVSAGIQAIPDKTVTINVRTEYDVGGGNVVGVTSHSIKSAAQLAEEAKKKSTPGSTAPTLRQINVSDYLSGTRAAGGPVSAGGTYLVGEEGPELVTMAGAGNVSSASSTANILSGGASVLSMIEENTFQTAEEIRRAVGYLETLETDGQTMLAVMRMVHEAIGKIRALSSSSSSSGGSSSGGGSTGYSSPGGFSSGGGGYSSRDARSPYYYSGVTQPGGSQYDPLADFMYNGNRGALGQIAGSGYSMYEATPWNNPFYGNRNRFQSNADIARMLSRQGPSGGAYGGGINITAESDWINQSGFFGFDSGGMIHPGDTQKVEFFKNPNEAVGVFRPEQMDAIGDAMGGGYGNVAVHYHAAPGNPNPSPRAMMELQDRVRQTVREVQGGL